MWVLNFLKLIYNISNLPGHQSTGDVKLSLVYCGPLTFYLLRWNAAFMSFQHQRTQLPITKIQTHYFHLEAAYLSCFQLFSKSKPNFKSIKTSPNGDNRGRKGQFTDLLTNRSWIHRTAGMGPGGWYKYWQGDWGMRHRWVGGRGWRKSLRASDGQVGNGNGLEKWECDHV